VRGGARWGLLVTDGDSRHEPTRCSRRRARGSNRQWWLALEALATVPLTSAVRPWRGAGHRL